MNNRTIKVTYKGQDRHIGPSEMAQTVLDQVREFLDQETPSQDEFVLTTQDKLKITVHVTPYDESSLAEIDKDIEDISILGWLQGIGPLVNPNLVTTILASALTTDSGNRWTYLGETMDDGPTRPVLIQALRSSHNNLVWVEFEPTVVPRVFQ